MEVVITLLTSVSLILTHTITQILEKNASIITDKKLDLLNKKILTCLNSEFGYDKVFDYETKRAYDELWRLGEVFKERLAKVILLYHFVPRVRLTIKQYLPDYKAAIQKIARCKPPEGWNDKIWGREIYPEQLLDQYIQLGKKSYVAQRRLKIICRLCVSRQCVRSCRQRLHQTCSYQL